MPSYFNYPMVLNGVYIGMIGLRTDQQNYFDIPPATQEELSLAERTTSGSNIQRNLFSNRLDSQTATRQVTVNRTARTKRRKKDHLSRGGRPIKIPTELTSTPPTQVTTNPSNTVVPRPSIRFTTIKFPGTADLAEISAWLYLKLVNHKPLYMKSPGGGAYPLAPFTGQITGQSGTTTP